MAQAPSCPVPVVDLSDFLRGDEQQRARVAAEWDAAMCSVGMAYIVGHGVPPEVIQSLHELALRFFTAPRESKMRYCLNKGYGAGGYVPQGVEAVARSAGNSGAPPDLVENFVFSHRGDPALESVPVPAEPPQLQGAVEQYWDAMVALLHTLMRLSATALSLPDDHFEQCFAQPVTHLRLGYYAAIPAVPEAAAADGAMRYGAHTDYTGFTILRQDPAVGGLEAQTADGSWHGVPSRAGALLVNAGDLIQVWTNDRWRSPPHRVVNPPPERAQLGRLSLVFFTGPADDTMVDALPSTHGADRPKRLGLGLELGLGLGLGLELGLGLGLGPGSGLGSGQGLGLG